MKNLDSPNSSENKEDFISTDIIFTDKNDDLKEVNRDSINFELTSSKVSQRKLKRKKTIVQTTQIDDNKEIFLKKIIRLNNIYLFTKKIGNFYSQILKKYFDSYFGKLNSFLNNEIKPFIKYFKELTNVYSNFSLELSKISNLLPNQKDDLILGQSLIEIISTTNTTLEKVLNELSSGLKKNLLSISVNKYENINIQFEENHKKIYKLIWEIEHRIIKLDNLYTKNYKTDFENFKLKFNDENIENEIILMNDFIMIEHNLVSYCNKILKKIEFYSNEILKINNNSNKDFKDYVLFIKNNLDIFKTQIFFNSEINLSIELNENIDFDFEKHSSINNIIKNNKELNFLIKKFQNNLIQNNYMNNKLIYEDSNFNIKNYEIFNDFITFMLKLTPKKISIEYNDLIEFKAPCLRDAGVFKGWRNCFIIITIQKHVIIFDEERDIKDDQIDMNKLFVIYNQNSIFVEKKTLKKSKFIISISEMNLKEKKSKYMQIDAIDEDNRNNIINAISLSKFRKI
jgi:hypothetical protein